MVDTNQEANINASVERIKSALAVILETGKEKPLALAISQYLNIKFNKNAEHRKYVVAVKIIDPKGGFSGINVYPELGELQPVLTKFADRDISAVTKAYTEISKYVIEIDQNMLERSIINFTPDELWALIYMQIDRAMSCHTIHIVFNDFMDKHSYLTMLQRASVARLVSIFYPIPVYTAMGGFCANVVTNKDYKFIPNDINEPIPRSDGDTDPIDSELQIRQHYVNAINKIIAKHGTTVIKDEPLVIHEMQVDINWCNLNIKDIMRRRSQLQAELINRAARATSFSMRFAILNICAQCGYGLKDKYTNKLIAMETVINDIDRDKYTVPTAMSMYSFTQSMTKTSAIESASAAAYPENTEPALEAIVKRQRPVLPSNYALDELALEIDRIENHYDKGYVLDLIYRRIDQVNIFEDAVRMDGSYQKYDTKIKESKEYLEKLRKAVLEKKIVPKSYGVYVKYPHGYEG